MAIEALAVIDELVARWNRKDPQEFAELFAEDADFTDVLGQTALGRPEIVQQHQFPFSRTLRAATLAADHVAMRTLGPDAAVARVHWSMTGPLSIDDEPLPLLRGKMHVALVRGEAGWHIVSVLNQNAAGVYAAQLPTGSEFKSSAD